MHEQLTRRFINNATRTKNIKTIKSKGVEKIELMLKESLELLESFRCLLVYIFQEEVVDDVAIRMFNALKALDISEREIVIKEIAERYMKFAELGYVLTIKTHLDKYAKGVN